MSNNAQLLPPFNEIQVRLLASVPGSFGILSAIYGRAKTDYATLHRYLDKDSKQYHPVFADAFELAIKNEKSTRTDLLRAKIWEKAIGQDDGPSQRYLGDREVPEWRDALKENEDRDRIDPREFARQFLEESEKYENTKGNPAADKTHAGVPLDSGQKNPAAGAVPVKPDPKARPT